jgi:tRNA uridine 5-carbamoylmethylation protein Kti12
LLRSAIDRAVALPRTVVIFDSLNNIKGYRYELWCLARGAGTRYAMVHIDTPEETCADWNSARAVDATYPADIFADLIRRFERPDARNRWDAPLFTVQPLRGVEHVAEQTKAVVAAVTEASKNVAVAAAAAAGATVVGATGRDLKPNLATTNAALSCRFFERFFFPTDAEQCIVLFNSRWCVMFKSEIIYCSSNSSQLESVRGDRHCENYLFGNIDVLHHAFFCFAATNLLNEIDCAAQKVVDTICEAQVAAGSGSVGVVRFGESLPTLNLQRSVPLQELRRWKRSFMKLATRTHFNKLTDAKYVEQMFIHYLRDNVTA